MQSVNSALISSVQDKNNIKNLLSYQKYDLSRGVILGKFSKWWR